MAWRVAGSILVLHAQLKRGVPRAAPPATPADAWGTIGNVAHDPSSDHAPHDFPGWGNDIVTAGDFPHAPALGLDARRVLNDIRLSRDARAKYGISMREIFSNHPVTEGGHTYPAWAWRPYHGDDPHDTHGHLSVVGDARADDTRPWQTLGGTMALSDAEMAELLANTREIRDRVRWVDKREEADALSSPTYKDPGGVATLHVGVQERKSLLMSVSTLLARPVTTPVELDDVQLSTLADMVAERLSALRFVATPE